MNRNHKRIFGQNVVQNPRAPTQPSQDFTPCYFHKDNRITKFCQCKQCTLPLCDVCQDIHLEEHQKHFTQPVIVSYANAREKAQTQLQSYIRRAKQGRQSILSILQAQKNQIQQTINTFFDDMMAAIESQTINDERLMDLERREEKITKGSVKALIQHYSETYSLVRFPKININFSASSLVALLQNFTSLCEEKEQVRPKSAIMVGGHFNGHTNMGATVVVPTGSSVNSGTHSHTVISQGCMNQLANNHTTNHQANIMIQQSNRVANQAPFVPESITQNEFNKKLDYSPKVPSIVKPFVHNEQRFPTFTAIQPQSQQRISMNAHTPQSPHQPSVYNTPIEHRVQQFVSPIQKLTIEQTNEKASVSQQRVMESKENIDMNAIEGQAYLQPYRQTVPVSVSISPMPQTQHFSHPSSVMVHEQLNSFRPQSRPASVEGKELRTAIQTMNRNSSRNSLQTVQMPTLKIDQKKPFTTQILSPEEIKAMIGKRNAQKDEVKTKRTDFVKHTESIHTVVPQISAPTVRLQDAELKHSYFDQPLEFQHRNFSFSPEFNSDGTTNYVQLYDKIEKAVREPHQNNEPYRYTPIQQKTGFLSINDLKTHTFK